MFSPTIKRKDWQSYDVIMTGMWSYQKGVDILSEACLTYMNISLLHVGGAGDFPLPVHERFTHIDAVDQRILQDYYRQAKIFVLPSRQEGLSLVQAQALSCGLPIVCSPHTGGRDLKDFMDDKRWIIEMETYTVEVLVTCIQTALALYKSMPDNKPRKYAGKECLDNLSWEAYGKRYSDFLKRIIH
jgi:glycosyltransferase involved in cell wall biosynthesis